MESALPIRILLIEDNLPDRVRYRRMLMRSGDAFDISESPDATSGLARLAADARYDCVLLDHELPDGCGLDVLRAICARADAPPVIMLTGEEDAQVSIDALRLGAADYLMKRRIDEDRLPRAIHAALERASLQSQVLEQQQRLLRFYRLANQTEDALFIVEAETATITDCNEAARTTLGLVTADENPAAWPAAFDSLEAWREFCQQVDRQGTARYQWRCTSPEGADIIVEILARRIEERGRSYIVAAGRDVTLRHEYEQGLIERSTRDSLTGVWNRRAFDERAAEYWAAAARKNRPLAVIMLDVDYFKPYNDALGHPAGDECLRQIAQALASGSLRARSMLARYGGEEFVALIDDADGPAALAVAERLRGIVLSLALPHPRSEVARCVTISAGAASLIPSVDQDWETLVMAADTALYRAKRNGRNRSVLDAV